MSARVAAAIQARMGSSRVPGKAMLEFGGKPMLWHLIDRLRRVPGLETIVLATTADPRNDPMVAYAAAQGIPAVREPVEDDLAGRIAKVFDLVGTDHLLKVGGDCPLIDPDLLDRMVRTAVATDGDFVSNRVKWSYPLGLSADVVSRRGTRWCHENLVRAEERELFALYLRDHPAQFRVVSIENDVDLSHHGWTVDTPEDVVFMRDIFDALYVDGQVFKMNDVLAYLEGKK